MLLKLPCYNILVVKSFFFLNSSEVLTIIKAVMSACFRSTYTKSCYENENLD